MKNAKQLKDDDIEKVTGGTGFDLEEENKPLEVDMPWWWKQSTEDNKKPMVNNDPFESNFFTDDGTPDW